MKAVVAAFNQEEALVRAFSVIVQPVVEPMDQFAALLCSASAAAAAAGWAQLRPAPRCRARRGQNQSQLTGGGQARAAHAAADQSTTTQTSHLTPGCRLAATLSCTLCSVHCVQQCYAHYYYKLLFTMYILPPWIHY